MIAAMSARAADVLFGQPTVADFDSDMYTLTRLVESIFDALDRVSVAKVFKFVGAELADESELIVAPDIWWDMPCPVWPAADFTVPQP